MLSLRDWMDASYTLLAEEHQRIDPLRSLLDISENLQPSRNAEPSRVKKQEVAASNEASLNILTAAMSGVKRGGPVLNKTRKPRR